MSSPAGKSATIIKQARRRAVFRYAILAAFLAVTGGCREKPSDNSLTIISPHPETLLYEYRRAFQSWYQDRTGRDIDVVLLDQGGTSNMRRYINNRFEQSPGGIDIDVVWGGGIDPYLDMAKRNLLHAYRLPEPILNAVPADYNGIPMYDSRHRWYGTALTGFGVIYNRRVLQFQGLAAPEIWSDLTDPAWQSWVGAADPRQSGSSHMAFEIILQARGWEEGWELITLLGANINVFMRLASDVPTETALGEIACGPCIDSYAYSQMAFSGRDVLGYVMPEGLTIVNPDGMGILKGAPNLDAAKRFTEFVMSDAGQRLLMAPVGADGGPRQFPLSRMAVLPHLYKQLGEESLVPVNPFQLKSTLRYDSSKGSARWKLVNDMIGSLIIENHDRLKEAWRAVGDCAPPVRSDLRRRLAAMPVTEEEAFELARNKWRDPVASNRIMLEWSRFARDKYEAVLQAAKESRRSAEARP